MATFVWTRAGRALACCVPGLLMLLPLGACGKRGMPLAPIVATPARILDVVPRRLGDTVLVRVTIPDANMDGTKPPDLDHVNVYAYTAMTQSAVRDLKQATLVGTIQVQRPVTPEQEDAQQKKGAPPPANPGEPPGGVGVVTEVLTPDMLIPVTPKEKPAKVEIPPETGTVIALPLTGPVPEPKPLRFYAAIGVSRKNVRGPNSPRPTIALDAPPPPPLAVTSTFSESAITLSWAPPADERAPIQAPAEKGSDVLNGTPKGVALSVVYAYNVYLVSGGGPAATGTPAPSPERQLPLNEKPLKTVEFDDPAMEFGKERCYVVRSVDRGVESAATAPVCVMPVDRFAPPAPAGLAAVASEGAVSLIWEGVEADDLAGYIVLRADGPAAALQPLFETPIRETAYRDASARPGTRYVYAVAAADTAKPRNVSAPSNRVEESAR